MRKALLFQFLYIFLFAAVYRVKLGDLLLKCALLLIEITLVASLRSSAKP